VILQMPNHDYNTDTIVEADIEALPKSGFLKAMGLVSQSFLSIHLYHFF